MFGTRFSNNGGVTTSAARLTVADERHRISAIAEFDDGDDVRTPEGEINPSETGPIQGAPSTNMVAYMVATMMTGKPPLQFANVDAEIWRVDAAWSYEFSEHLLVDQIRRHWLCGAGQCGHRE